MNHVMLDLETMGTEDNAPIISIGACYFNPENGEIGSKFYVEIDIKQVMSSSKYVSSIETMMWWMKQSDEARSVFNDTTAKIDICSALDAFHDFVKDDVQVWGNGISFDIGKINYSMKAEGLTTPIAFYNERDVRTIVELGHAINVNPKRDMEFEGVQHNALDDAIHQAKYVSSIWQSLTGDKHND